MLYEVITGTGLRRGRRDPVHLRTGDVLDFWRVLEAELGKKLLLLAEMKMPGEATLDIDIETVGPGITELRFLSRFMPKGVSGMLYWYGLYPFHQFVFRGMLRNLARAVRKPVISGPERFTPVIPDSCPPPWNWS